MRIRKAAIVSRLIAPLWLGVMFTDTAGLTDACILRPRYRYATSQNGPRHDVDDQNQSQQHQARRPRLPVPILVRRNSVRENHHWQRRRRLLPTVAPAAVSVRGEQPR